MASGCFCQNRTPAHKSLFGYHWNIPRKQKLEQMDTYRDNRGRIRLHLESWSVGLITHQTLYDFYFYDLILHKYGW
jgi:hypothetical protein